MHKRNRVYKPSNSIVSCFNRTPPDAPLLYNIKQWSDIIYNGIRQKGRILGGISITYFSNVTNVEVP